MVVGVCKSLEEGRTYSYADLSERFGLRKAEFAQILDYLIDRGCLKPKLFESVCPDGATVVACTPLEHRATSAAHCRAPAATAAKVHVSCPPCPRAGASPPGR